jgi:pimeloyl-ACP methyl ester carboxylesterase
MTGGRRGGHRHPEWQDRGVGERARLVDVDGVELCVETFGSARDPSILLIAGTSSPMDSWADGLCQMLAAGHRHVIRYDNRDVGRSTSFPVGAPGYSFDDLVGDAVHLLDVLGVARAHLVGMSLGGAVARSITLDHPGRVLSLTLMSTSPQAPGDPADPSLPPPDDALLDFFREERPEPDLEDRAAYIDNFSLWERHFAGDRYFDEAAGREYAGRVFDRTRDIRAASINHGVAGPGRPVRARLGEIDVPTLVIHGTVDPILPIGHAEALVREIRGARLLALDGVGHQMPPPALWQTVVSAILGNTDVPPD